MSESIKPLPATDLLIPKAKLDFSSIKTQMIIGFFLSFTVCATVLVHNLNLVNNFLAFACSVLVSLITLELTGLFGNRLGAAAAIWAGLIFAVHPLHLQTVLSADASSEQLCVFFYLGSIFFYLRYYLLREQSYFWLTLCSMLFALLASDIAATIPFVLLCTELFLYLSQQSTQRQRKSFTHFLKRTSAFFAVFVAYWLVKFSHSQLLMPLLSMQDVRNQLAIYSRIFYPFTEQSNQNNFLADWLSACYTALFLLFLLRTCFQRQRFSPTVFVSTLFSLQILFQLVFFVSNKINNHLLLLPSAESAILIPLVALPCFGASNKSDAKIQSTVGVLLLFFLFLCLLIASVQASGSMNFGI